MTMNRIMGMVLAVQIFEDSNKQGLDKRGCGIIYAMPFLWTRANKSFETSNNDGIIMHGNTY